MQVYNREATRFPGCFNKLSRNRARLHSTQISISFCTVSGELGTHYALITAITLISIKDKPVQVWLPRNIQMENFDPCLVRKPISFRPKTNRTKPLWSCSSCWGIG